MTYLAVVHGKVQMVQGVVRRPVDDLLEWVARDHVRVVDLHKISNYITFVFDAPEDERLARILHIWTKTKRQM